MDMDNPNQLSQQLAGMSLTQESNLANNSNLQFSGKEGAALSGAGDSQHINGIHNDHKFRHANHGQHSETSIAGTAIDPMKSSAKISSSGSVPSFPNYQNSGAHDKPGAFAVTSGSSQVDAYNLVTSGANASSHGMKLQNTPSNLIGSLPAHHRLDRDQIPGSGQVQGQDFSAINQPPGPNKQFPERNATSSMMGKSTNLDNQQASRSLMAPGSGRPLQTMPRQPPTMTSHGIQTPIISAQSQSQSKIRPHIEPQSGTLHSGNLPSVGQSQQMGRPMPTAQAPFIEHPKSIDQISNIVKPQMSTQGASTRHPPTMERPPSSGNFTSIEQPPSMGYPTALEHSQVTGSLKPHQQVRPLARQQLTINDRPQPNQMLGDQSEDLSFMDNQLATGFPSQSQTFNTGQMMHRNRTSSNVGTYPGQAPMMGPPGSGPPTAFNSGPNRIIPGQMPPTITSSGHPGMMTGQMPPTINSSGHPGMMSAQMPPTISGSGHPGMIPGQIPPTVNSSEHPRMMPGQMPPTINSSGHPGMMPPTRTTSGHPGMMPGQMPATINSSRHPVMMPPRTNSSGHPSMMPGQMPPTINSSGYSAMMPGQMPPTINSSGHPGMMPGQMLPTINSSGHPGMVPGQMPPTMTGSGHPGMMPGQIPPTINSSGHPGMVPGQMPPTMTGSGPPGMMPGSNLHMSGRPAMQPSTVQRRLRPDDMPSPIQVIEDDKKIHPEMFFTHTKGLVPPLVTTPVIIVDQGNASPKFIRSTMYTIPETPDMMKQVGVPFAICISPFAEPDTHPLHLVDNGEMGPIRCNRCKAYMCPFMQFIDGGRRFQCAFCKATTEVPPEYFQHLDQVGRRIDWLARPELHLGTYEVLATKMYCTNETLPKPPAIIFLIDVSYNNVRSGLVHLFCANIKEMLMTSLPNDGCMKVGFITYNNAIHFYNNKGCLAQPQMLVVSDVQDVFMPLLDGFFCDPCESEAIIDGLLEQIPLMFGDTRETETVLGSAIQAGLEALKAAERAGKLFIFHSSLPTADAPGKLKNRDERKLLGTDKEKAVLTPQNNFYNDLGQDCVLAGCSVDLFIFNNAYVDLATIGQISRLTGGHIYKYTYFQAETDGECFLHDLRTCIKHLCAFDVVLRVRTSTGVRPVDFFGHFFMSNTTNIQFAALDSHKAICVEIKHDDKLTEEDGVYIQVATLYTSCGGERRLRIINLSLNIASQMADVFKACELNTIINYFSKAAISKIGDSTPKVLRDGLIQRCALILSTYRNKVASPSPSGQLILPECMKLLPLYLNCLLKSDSVSGGSDLTVDERAFLMFTVQSMDVLASMNYFYPRLIPLSDIDFNTPDDDIPTQIRCSVEKVKDDGVYLLENGINMFMWIGLNVPTDYITKVFGVQSPAQINIDSTKLPEMDNVLSKKVRSIIDNVRSERHRFLKLCLVRQRDKLDIVFRHFLCEDGVSDLKMSYIDFLCLMHREIRNLLG